MNAGDMMNWRDINARVVEWAPPPSGSRRACWTVRGLCRHPRSDAPERNVHLMWHAITLGAIADMGEPEWRRISGVGDAAVAVIKRTIDLAAAGRDVTKRDDRAPYVPQPVGDLP